LKSRRNQFEQVEINCKIPVVFKFNFLSNSAFLFSLPSQAPNTSSQPRIFTYNIFLRPPTINTNGDDFKNERLEEFFHFLPQYDIICLQEMFSLANWRQRRLIQRAREAGFHYHIKSSPPSILSPCFIDAGLLILSRYPILEGDAYLYTAGAQIDYFAAKQVLYAKIGLEGGNAFHLFTTHMQATYNENTEAENVINGLARKKQVEEMAQFVYDKCEGNEWPAVVTGDFNIDFNDDEMTGEYSHLMKSLQRSGFVVKDLVAEEFEGQARPSTYGDGVIVDGKKYPIDTALTHAIDYCCNLAIDYIIWVRREEEKGWKVKEGETRIEKFLIDGHPKFTQLSDHYGVSSQIICE